jgi:hypothetical protein
MSPVNDDVVLFVVLAAGRRPVAAPVSPWTGNIDVAAVPDRTWATLAGVLTANLYGIPDPVVELRERCERFGLTLVEDACHAIDTTAGRSGASARPAPSACPSTAARWPGASWRWPTPGTCRPWSACATG